MLHSPVEADIVIRSRIGPRISQMEKPPPPPPISHIAIRPSHIKSQFKPLTFINRGRHSVVRSVRTLENTLESQITTYAKLCTSVSTAYSSNGTLNDATVAESREVEGQIEDGLKQLSLLVDQMLRLLETTSPAPTSSMQHASTRHKEILADYERDFIRTRTSLREAEQRASLLSSVRSEISSFKSQQALSNDDRHLADRDRINTSHRLADDVLNQAYETRYEFSRQRNSIMGSNTRMGGVIASIPGVNSLVGMINSRRRRDTMILATVAGTCTFLLLLFTFR
ncbi:hypothetical protein CROQUDRAFT_103026 [Cronartium quercuum f. sp. fusiforme G11]|uniref:Golgi SNAP receptor complex member 1 n=1 Tax=Cronartium quercuum f. sp. fusiforme G11 TaxID=708437 RepID=A0A9P6TIA5_9BASI|nr:hypothetical protein CROQUDRAFT_103026 [Cronartium quercuum f. sp. fusiforme G11]